MAKIIVHGPMDFESVDPELWSEIARFDRIGEIHMIRSGEPAQWHITIRFNNEIVVASDLVLAVALRSAIAEARRRGFV